MLRRIADASCLELGGPGLGDDHREVFRIAKVRFAIQVDFPTLLQSILGGLYRHLHRNLLADLLPRLGRCQRALGGAARRNAKIAIVDAVCMIMVLNLHRIFR
jgi:hypothetical protein